jgi:hypothetical protein
MDPSCPPQAGRIVNGDSEIIAQLRARPALQLVFMLPRRPFAGEIDLGGSRDPRRERQDKTRQFDLCEARHYFFPAPALTARLLYTDSTNASADCRVTSYRPS